jgi:hypothetical protein
MPVREARNVRCDRWNRAARFKICMALRTPFHRRGGQVHRTDMLDVATAARLRARRNAGMMRPHLMTAQARGIGHVMTCADDRHPPRARDERLVARIALLRENGVRRRHRPSGKRSRIARGRQADPHDCRKQRDRRQPPLPQPNRRALFEVVEVMPLGDRLRCAFANCQARPPFWLSVVSSQWHGHQLETGNSQLVTAN